MNRTPHHNEPKPVAGSQEQPQRPMPAPPLTNKRRARQLFRAESKPLDAAASNLVNVRHPRRSPRLWVAVAFICVCSFQAPADDTNASAIASTNTPGSVGIRPSNTVAQPNLGMTTNRTASVSNSPPARVAASVGPPVAARSARPKALDYSAFRIINDRNIFDPNRNPRRSDSGPRPKPKTIESFSLVGIMAYEKGTFAFFDGTSSQYRKALKSADTIAGFKLDGIEGNAVRLSSTNKEVELKVGMQLRREEEGEWQLSSTQAEPYASSSATSASASAASTNSPTAAASGASAASSGSADDVLKRLMQRREQE